MELISSRKNQYIHLLRQLQTDGALRDERREYVCEGEKLFNEALQNGAEIKSVLLRQNSVPSAELPDCKVCCATDDVFDYASTMVNSPGPVFTVAYPEARTVEIKKAIVLEGVQDPGNVGTVVRTANAFGVDAVVLAGQCADIYNPKTVRATMGAVFRQYIVKTDLTGLKEFLKRNGLPLYGAALSSCAVDIRTVSSDKAAYAVGSEGNGLTEELLSMCEKQVIIPMKPSSESLNAAVAASVIMWIACGQEL